MIPLPIFLQTILCLHLYLLSYHPSYAFYKTQTQSQNQRYYSNSLDIRGGSSSSSSSTSSSSTSSSTSMNNNEKEKEKYSSLPHTIFSPQGRLYNVEKAAQLSSSSDENGHLTLAFKFGGGDGDGNGTNNDNDNGESILILSTSSNSPYLHYSKKKKTKANQKKKNKHNNDNPQKIEPLWKHHLFMPLTTTEQQQKQQQQKQHEQETTKQTSISILSKNILIGTGGNAIDTIVLHNKILEIFLSLSKSFNNMNSTHCISGIVYSSLLARKIADNLQIPTQNISANSGKILSSSALVIGMNELLQPTSSPRYKNSIWRIDPTGQFWQCHAAAVGKGAGLVEGAMLQYVQKWKNKNSNVDTNSDIDADADADTNADTDKSKKMDMNDDTNDIDNDCDDDDLETLLTSISNQDVIECFQDMSFDDAIKFACDCICKVHKVSNRDDFEKVGIEGVLIPGCSTRSIGNSNGNSIGKSLQPEVIHSGIIRGCLNSLVSV